MRAKKRGPKPIKDCEIPGVLLARSYADPITGCRIWTRAKSSGYGYIRLKGRAMRAHRVSYSVFVGPIPKGMIVCHKCDNPSCIEPSHLFLGTDADNMADKIAKGRAIIPPPKPGELHNMAILTANEVMDIRARFDAGETSTSIAQSYPITPGHVCHICAGHAWKHLPACKRSGRIYSNKSAA